MIDTVHGINGVRLDLAQCYYSSVRRGETECVVDEFDLFRH